jgi:putative ABC transport system ATP-binding protein
VSISPVIRLSEIGFSYAEGAFELDVPELEIESRERVACIGPSGTGKSTLVNLIAGILVPDRGTVEVGGARVSHLADSERRARRLARIGMVFQELELLEYLDVFDNILLPFHLASNSRITSGARDRVRALASETGIASLLGRKPHELSQGERQRVAIARALVAEPELLLCDEPTGNLDPTTAGEVLDLLFREAETHGATLLLVTHDHATLDRFDRIVDMTELIRRGGEV